MEAGDNKRLTMGRRLIGRQGYRKSREEGGRRDSE